METGITGALLLTAALAVANSIVAADWVADMPDLYVLALLAVGAAAVLAASPLHWSLALLVGVLAGAALVLWQVLTVESVAGQPFFFDRFEDLWFRLEDWFRQAFNSGITTDNLPFILFVASAMWLATFLGALVFLRGRNPWVFLILLGIMLAVNVSYVRGQQWDINFAIFVGRGRPVSHAQRSAAAHGPLAGGRNTLPGLYQSCILGREHPHDRGSAGDHAGAAASGQQRGAGECVGRGSSRRSAIWVTTSRACSAALIPSGAHPSTRSATRSCCKGILILATALCCAWMRRSRACCGARPTTAIHRAAGSRRTP